MRSPSCPDPVNATAASAKARPSPTPRRRRSSADTPSTSVAHSPSGWTRRSTCIDTPGFLDFQGDAIAGLAAADGALCVVGATSGVEVGTERMFQEAVSRGDPVLFVVTMMDKENADFDAIYEQIKSRLTSKVIPIEVPVGEGPDFHGIVNLFDKKAHVYARGTQDGRVRGDRRSARGAAALRSLLRGADRDDRRRRTTPCSSATSTAARSDATTRSAP